MDAMLRRPLRRHRWVVCAGVVVGLAGAAGAFAASDPVYASSASVLVRPVGPGAVNLNTEAQLARSAQTLTVAVRALPEGMSLDPQGLTVEPLPDTSVLVIRYEAGTPEAAQAGARIVAEAYLANRSSEAKTQLAEQAKAVNDKIAEVTEQLASINARLSQLPADSNTAADLRSTAATLSTQITILSTRANELATTTVDPGQVIEPARLPSRPLRPVLWQYAAAGLGAGVLLGLAAAFVRERLTRRVRLGANLDRRCGVPVLAELPGHKTLARVMAARDPGGRSFNRLRNEVVAALGARDRVILVTGASPGSASTVVAANLAAALARAGNDVVLVGANVPEMTGDAGTEMVPLSHIFDIADVPGLTDVLARRIHLSGALQQAPRTPRLAIVTPGGAATAGGLLQSEGARTALRTLARQARYVVVEAPSAAAGADAQSLAGMAHAAILVAEAGRTRYAEVADAATQLRHVGTHVLGAVVVPRVVVGFDGDGDEDYRHAEADDLAHSSANGLAPDTALGTGRDEATDTAGGRATNAGNVTNHGAGDVPGMRRTPAPVDVPTQVLGTVTSAQN